MSLFPEAKDMDLSSLIFMMIVYGYILMKGSELIGDGSEMLLLTYGPGIIGGLLIPILGTLPDCAVILVSGLGNGTKKKIQHDLSVGVGTLVGSTIMLLTVTWAMGIFLGRRDVDSKTGSVISNKSKKLKVTHFSLTTNGVTVLGEISGTAKVMMFASLTYLIIQIPAFFYKSNPDQGVKAEAPFALAGLIVAFVVFAIYCFLQYFSAQQVELTRLQQESLRKTQWKKSLDSRLSKSDYQELIFRKHDKDNSGYIEAVELKTALVELGLNLNRTSIKEMLDQIDIGNKDDGDEGKKDGKISLNEFKHAINTWIREGRSNRESENPKYDLTKLEAFEVNNQTTEIDQKLVPFSQKISLNNIEEKDEDEEEEEQEEEFLELTDNQIKLKASFLLLLGTIVCTIFSDPLVDVISSIGTKMKVSPFYISFVITPLASNASEVIAGLMFAKKKTTESITLTLATLHGAATMNSTLGLGIFMSLIYFRNLSWSFSAEVITVLLVIFLVGLNSLRKNIFMWQAVFVFSLYPLSIVLIYVLENNFGLD